MQAICKLLMDVFRDCQNLVKLVTNKLMPTVAEQLRQAREQRKLSVYDVAEATKIRTDHIRALEQGDFQMFAAPVYIRGFVRNYAALLKLDAPKIIEELDLELAATEKFKDPPQLMGASDGVVDAVMLKLSKVNWQLFAVFLLVVLAGLALYAGYRVWDNWQTKDPLADLSPGLYQPAPTNAGELLPLPAPAQPRAP